VRSVADGGPLPLREIVTTVLRTKATPSQSRTTTLAANPSRARPTRRRQAAAQATYLRFFGHLVLGEHDSWNQA